MKNVIALCCVILCCTTVNAQSFDSAVHYRLTSPSFHEAMDYFIQETASNPSDTGEEKLGAVLERRKLWMSGRACFDVAVGADMSAPMSTALSSYLTYYSDFCPSTGYMGDWKCLGPFQDYYGKSTEQNGRIDAIWVHPSDTGHILIGANGGGVWKTNNGGRSWRCLTDGALGTSSSVFGMAGVQCIAVNPSDTNIIYIAQGGREQSKKSYNYGLGLVYTTNGGSSWHSDGSFNSLISTTSLPEITKIAYMPGTQKLFAISEKNVLYKPSPSDPWQDITPTGFSPVGHRWCFDMEFTHSPTGKVVVSFGSLSNTSYLCTYNPSTDTWSYMPMTMTGGYTQPDFHYGAVRFSLSSSDIAYMQFRAKDGSGNHASLLIKSPITTYSQDIKNYALTDNVTGRSMLQLMDFAVSPANSNIIYAVNYNSPYPIMISTDEGANFSQPPGTGHADGDAVFIHSATNTSNGINDVVYIGNDGGIRKKRYGTLSFAGITGKNLCITQFFGFGNTEADDALIMGGAQDVGTWGYDKHLAEPWRRFYGSDGYTAKFAVNGVKKAFGESNTCSPPCLQLHLMHGWDFSSISIGFPSFTVATPTDTNNSNINRPQYFNPQNTAHVGYSYIWKKSYDPVTFWNFGAWERTFARDPINYDATHAYRQVVVDFHIDENNIDKVYIAYRDAVGDHDPLDNEYGKLYYASDANVPIPSWTNITPDICVDNGINSIMVDPSNPARIWVAFGNINYDYIETAPADMDKRVYYSDNNGATWTNASKGLSALPVNKLLYRKGSDDEMYAGTDAGVFKWNKVACQWECFNNGLPPCTVMDMEFNYCANKLRVATFGRGIWETPLQVIWDIVQVGEEITSNTTWTQDRYVAAGIRVKAGNTLNIKNCAIHMPRNGALIVEKNAKLIVDGATLTNNCDGCLWYGIEAIGNPSAPQSPTSNQAWIVIKNGSRIEHARYAVSNCDYWNDPTGTTGGIIQATNSTFYNNHNSVTLLEYHSPGTPHAPNTSYFSNCTFLNDVNYRGVSFGYYMRNHVDLKGVDGIRFSGCKFINRDWRMFETGQGVGISSFNSSFKVEPYCASSIIYPGYCPDLRRSYFCGLEDGIAIKDVVGVNATVSIDQADFDSSSIGVYISGQNNVSTTRCNFIVGRGNDFDSTIIALNTCGNIGIAIQNAILFKMEGNNFKGRRNYSTFSYSSWNTYGTVIANSGWVYENKVFRNSFDSLTEGVRAIGNNRGPYMGITYGMGGLQILCNAFSTNKTDISITPDGSSGSQGLGFETGYFGRPAKNTFFGSTNNILNSCPYVNYYYDEANAATEKPSVVSSSIWRVGTTNGTSCAPTYSSSGGAAAYMPSVLDRGVLSQYKTAFKAHKADYFSLLDTHSGLIDLGEPAEYLKNYIDTTTNPDTLYNKLISASPYLSDDVLKYVTSASQLSYNQMDSVFIKNPEVMRHDGVFTHVSEFFTQLQANNQQLPDYVSSITDACNKGTTSRIQLEAQISYARTSMSDEAATILMALKCAIDTSVSVSDTTGAGICTDTNSVYYTLDSSAFYHGFDSLDVWLQNVGSVDMEYERIGYYNFLKEYATAGAIFDGIDRNSLPEEMLPTYDSYKELWDVIYAAENSGRSIYELNENDIAALDTFSLPEITYNRGRQLLWNISGVVRDMVSDIDAAAATSGPVSPPYTFPCMISILTPARPVGAGNDDEDIDNSNYYNIKNLTNNHYKLKVYPNPTSGIVTFEYNGFELQSSNTGVRVSIMNMFGEKVMEQQNANNIGKLYWDPQNLPSGIYFYRISNADGIIGNGKIVLTK